MPTYERGHVRLPNKDDLIRAKHASHMAAKQAFLSAVTADEQSWDSWTKNWVPPIRDQKQCGSCWDFSGTRVCNTAFVVAGVFPSDGSKNLSEQYTLDCGRNGGCNGDDNVSVLDWAKKTGLPFDSEYGPYQARAGRCKQPSSLNKIDDWGFADGNGGNGVTDTMDIKKFIKTLGGVGCAVAAGSSWDGYQAGTVHHGNSNQIDHDVFLSGWNDTAGKTTSSGVDKASASSVVATGGWWWMDNSWGPSWGEKGRMRIAYGADSIGTEAVWAVVKSVIPNPPDALQLWFA